MGVYFLQLMMLSVYCVCILWYAFVKSAKLKAVSAKRCEIVRLGFEADKVEKLVGKGGWGGW